MIQKIIKQMGKSVAALWLMVTMLTSCDTFIAGTLEGTWEGNMYVTSYLDGREYHASYTELGFVGNPFSMASGHGYWVDYYSSAPWDYLASHITWKVSGKIIHIHFIEDDYDIDIHDYSLDDDRFMGYIYSNGERCRFRLKHTSSPNWDNYDYGFSGYGPGYLSDHRSLAAPDSAELSVSPQVKRPERRVGLTRERSDESLAK